MKKYINISSFGLSYSLKDSSKIENADIIISDDENDIRYALSHNTAHIFISNASDCSVFAKNVYIPDTPALPIPDNDYIENAYIRHNRLLKTIAYTERLIIRELSFTDMEKIHNSGFGFTSCMSEEDRAAYYDSYYTSMYDFAEFGYYGFFDRHSEALLGYGGLSLEDDSDTPNAGYFIFDKYRHLGYASEGMDAVLTCAERDLLINEIIFKISMGNTASVAVAEKLSLRHKSVKIVPV